MTTYGSGGIGSASVSTLSKDLRRRFAGDDPAFVEWKLDPATYTMKDAADRARTFLFELAQASGSSIALTYWVFGYSAGRPLPEIWSTTINGADCEPAFALQDEAGFGPNWAGAEEALDWLIFGRTRAIVDAAAKQGMDVNAAVEVVKKMGPDLYEMLVMPAMPIQDAIDLARFMVETTIGFSKFSISRPKTVGGPIEIAVITKHEGFRWIARKHFYSRELNP